MTRKIPEDAFQAYFAMGPARSYQAVAERYGVSKRSVTRFATRQNWSERIAKIENEARERADRRAVETLDEMNERHLRIAKAIQAKALESLRSLPMEKAIDAVRALDVGVRQERLVRGEPTERQASVEELIRSETRELLMVVDGGNEPASTSSHGS